MARCDSHGRYTVQHQIQVHKTEEVYFLQSNKYMRDVKENISIGEQSVTGLVSVFGGDWYWGHWVYGVLLV